MVPASDGGDDFVVVGGPLERLGLSVVVVEEAVDGGLKIDDGAESAALEPSLAQHGEEALDGVEPVSGSWGEMEGPARMTRQPFPRLGMLVSGIVVENGVNGLAGGNFALDGVEEPDELLMAVARQITVPSRMFIAANSVVVPLRL